MKYYIKEYRTLINLDDWHKIRKCSDTINNVTVYCIEMFYKPNNTTEMYYFGNEDYRDLIFNAISDLL